MVIVVGVSHKAAPIEVRERVAFLESDLVAALGQLVAATGLPEAMLLSTCNRTEVYAVPQGGGEVREPITAFLSRDRRVPREVFESYLYEHRDEEAVAHLFRVASGVDSMVVGEAQILGQVKQAFAAAQAAGTAGPVLDALLREAISIGKRARDETSIGRGAASVPSAAVTLARRVFGQLRGRGILIVGAGKMGELTVRSLVDAGARQVIVANRTVEHAQTLATVFGGQAVGLVGLARHLAEADIVITSTGAAHPVIGVDLVRGVMARRNGSQLFIIDIAVPRDVHPGVGTLAGVHLYNVDHLQQIAEETLRARRDAVAEVERLVEDAVRAFQDWHLSLEAAPIIAALRRRAEAIIETELTRARGRLRRLGPEEVDVVRRLTESVVNKLLHTPIVRLKESAARRRRAYLEAARDLFDLPEDGAEGER
ncbi:MAG: glutamyl-tRNA reductase [Armatimonadetes bacterium]|nr:glutamyl-tRNA reductase [Armatimonadota bacterium]